MTKLGELITAALAGSTVAEDTLDATNYDASIDRLLAVLEAGYEGVAHDESCTTVVGIEGECNCLSAALMRAIAACHADPLLATVAPSEASASGASCCCSFHKPGSTSACRHCPTHGPHPE